MALPVKPSVYFAQMGPSGPIKIGFSGNVDRRIRDLNQGCPYVVRWLISFSGTREAERALHRHYADLRLRGEWFRPACDLVARMNGARRMTGLGTYGEAVCERGTAHAESG